MEADMHNADEKSWWRRIWKWYARKATLSPLLLFCGGVLGFSALVLGSMKSSGAYQEALQRAKNDSRLVNHLGGVIEPGWFLYGSVEVSDSSGNADLEIPLHGPSASATLYVVAHKNAGNWEFTRLDAQVIGQDGRINLLLREGE